MTHLFVNILGGNASRKTTKVNCMFEYLRKHSENFEKIPCGYVITYKGLNYVFIGKIINSVLMGFDSRPFGEKDGANAYQNKLNTYKKIIEEYKPFFILGEGYFNNGGSYQYENYENILQYGFTGYRYFYQMCDTFDEQKKLIKIRNDVYESHLRRSENNFKHLHRSFNHFKNEQKENIDTLVQKVSPFVENDYYLKFFFNVSYPEFSFNNNDDLSDF